MRPYTEYADRLYLSPEGPAHIVPWSSTKRSLCGIAAFDAEWYGSGDWDEIEYAAQLSLCSECHALAYPQNVPLGPDPAVTTWHDVMQNTK